jgi:hypothetical protein
MPDGSARSEGARKSYTVATQDQSGGLLNFLFIMLLKSIG